MNGLPSDGVGLEARVQRVFFAQGMFAEARLFPSADKDHRMLATDIDVLASAYGAGFHLTRRHAECKGGKTPILDRVLWMTGVRRLLSADASFLVVRDFDEAAARFANGLDIQFMSLRQLDDLERALKVPPDVWPCRCDYQVIEPLRAGWRSLASASGDDEVVRGLKEVQGFIEIDSWLKFGYGDLNRALRHLKWLGDAHPTLSANHRGWCEYLIAALHVRFAQYLLSVCLDVNAVVPTDLKEYLIRKLTYGDQDPDYISAVVAGTVTWVKQSLSAKGIDFPTDIDTRRLMDRPPYAEEFVDLIRALTDAATESVYLVLATEVQEFDELSRLTGFPRLVSASQAGDKMAALVSGFLIRALGMPKNLLSGFGAKMRSSGNAVVPAIKRSKSSKATRAQRALSIDTPPTTAVRPDRV